MKSRVNLRLLASTLVKTLKLLLSTITSFMPYLLHSLNALETSLRARILPIWKHRIFVAGFICRKRASQFCGAGCTVRSNGRPPGGNRGCPYIGRAMLAMLEFCNAPDMYGYDTELGAKPSPSTSSIPC